MHEHLDDEGAITMPEDLTPDHDAPDRPDEQARRERPPEEAVKEMEAVLEDQTTPTHDMPPLSEKYGGVPDDSDDR